MRRHFQTYAWCCTVFVVLSWGTARAGDILSIDGTRFRLDGKPFDMWGVRVPNALWDDATVQACINELPTYLSYGVNTIYVNLQGCWPGFDRNVDPNTGKYYDSSTFNPDGSLRPQYLARLQRLLEATRNQNMVVNICYFYQRQCRRAATTPYLDHDHFVDNAAIFRAMRNITEWLKPYRHVFIDVANEFGHEAYDYDDVFPWNGTDKWPTALVLQKAKLLVDSVHAVDPNRICGVSPWSNCGALEVSSADVWFYHGSGISRTPSRHDRPIINNESWHAPAYRVGDPGIRLDGVYTEDQKDMLKNEPVQQYNMGYFWFWHSGWLLMYPFRFDVGGDGTEQDPGDRWMFEHIHQFRFKVTLSDLDAEVADGKVHLSWKAETRLENTRFNVYRCAEPFFSLGGPLVVKVGAAVADQDPATQAIDWSEAAEGFLGNPAQNAFYAITATHGGLESALYGYAGELDFPLVITAGTDFNAVALPFAQQTPFTAADLVARFPCINSVACLDPESGQFQQYAPQLPATNFLLNPAEALLVNATAPGVMSLAGALVNGSYQLKASLQGRLNTIVLPFSKRHLTKASDLLANIPRCTQVGRWNPEAQAVEFYQPSQPASNFTLIPGWPYFVRVSQDVTWP
ncbi:MAG: hypothetical protein QHJ34_01870 [bacterium]|jgi:hypothetical protein|nr:hypothetical protein [candidate division KSB1 bacterium]MDH7558966.1 hypothetical protein [bacterium]